MSQAQPTLAVFGATGHTGRFVVEEARRRGLPVIAVGRDAARLEVVGDAGVERRVARLDDAPSLERAFAGSAVVINCAGPFLDTAGPVARAALRAGSHYIDVTAEQPSARATLAEFDAPARAAGLAVIPAAGFYGGLADLVASSLAADGPVDEITVAIGLDRWWPTEGTRRTGDRNRAPRVVVADGRLAPFVPSNAAAEWAFAAPVGRQAMVEMPFSEIVTMAHHLEARTIRSWLNRSALEDIRDASTAAPTAVDAQGRSAQRFELVVELVQRGTTRRASVRGQDIYAVTAPIVVEAAVRLPSSTRRGALALAQIGDARELLRALEGTALELDLPS